MSTTDTNDLIIVPDEAEAVGSNRTGWVVSRRGRRLGATGSYRDAFLRASALARRFAANVWCKEDGRLLLVLGRNEF
jgi:hypothetical protein